MLTLLSVVLDAIGADFALNQVDSGRSQLELSGEILKDDSNKLIALISSNPVAFLDARTIVLKSPGGDIEESARIASIIEQAALITVVDPDETCASACFFVFVAGPVRWGRGTILIHRPYFQDDVYDSGQLANALSDHRDVMVAVRRYLEERSIPTHLIDEMIRRPSNDGYALTRRDLLEIGIMTPTFEEASIATCGVSARQFLDGGLSENGISCMHGLASEARAQLLVKTLGEQQAQQAIRTYLLSKGGIELPNGRIVVPRDD
jgi:hypothetical protein